MYVRFEQVLCQIEEIEDNYISFDRDFYDHWNELTCSMNYDRFINDYKPKASYKIIDLIEVGDIIVGLDGHKFEVYAVASDCVYINELKEFIMIDEILSIVTKESMESMSYKVGE